MGMFGHVISVGGVGGISFSVGRVREEELTVSQESPYSLTRDKYGILLFVFLFYMCFEVEDADLT